MFCRSSNTWYYYNKFNIIHSSDSVPATLKTEITTNCISYSKSLHAIVRGPSKSQSDYEDQLDKFESFISFIYKMYHTIGSQSHIYNISNFLKTYLDNDNIEKLVDTNQTLIAFCNGVCYDVTKNIYRKVTKSDFISKTTSIPYSKIQDADTDKI